MSVSSLKLPAWEGERGGGDYLVSTSSISVPSGAAYSLASSGDISTALMDERISRTVARCMS